MTNDEISKDTSQIAIKFGKNLKFFREKRGMTQTELAKAMKGKGWKTYSQVGVARTETGSRMVRLDEALSLAGCLSLKVDDLLDTQSAKYGLYESAKDTFEEMCEVLDSMNLAGWKFGELRERLALSVQDFKNFQGDLSEDAHQVEVARATIDYLEKFENLSALEAMEKLSKENRLTDKAGNTRRAFPFDGTYPTRDALDFNKGSSDGDN